MSRSKKISDAAEEILARTKPMTLDAKRIAEMKRTGRGDSLGFQLGLEWAALCDYALDALREAEAERDALRAVAEQMASAGRRLIGAVEACALADHGGPAVNWPAVDASQDAMRDAIRAWPIDGESMRHAKDREVIAVLPDFVPMIDEFTRAVTAIAKERDALRAVAEQAREALKETERLLSKAHDAMYGLPDGGSREGSEYPTREERTEASWQLHYAHAVTRPALAALDTVLEPRAENHE